MRKILIFSTLLLSTIAGSLYSADNTTSGKGGSGAGAYPSSGSGSGSYPSSGSGSGAYPSGGSGSVKTASSH
ncbi:MAG: hypothetical protein K2W94_07865 [Alphaproteobacteria bacterium]|nr:hypothetical protein [Alphaproteobacteria bacterium]